MVTASDAIGRMPPYGAQHLIVLAATVVLAVVLVRWARRARTDPERAGRALTFAGWVYLAAALAWMAWDLVPINWNVEQSLPLHLSDALKVFTAVALITRRPWAIAITYYWGLTLNLQSVITPDLNYFHAPALEFAAYWVFHIAALIAPIVLVWGFGHRQSWLGYGTTLAITAVWGGAAGVVNAALGTNYMYLAHAPAGPSVLDLLGGWPAYLAWEAVLIVVVWALMTWPWHWRANGAAPAHRDDEPGLRSDERGRAHGA